VTGKVTVGRPRAAPLMGLRNGGQVVPRCSNCDRPLCTLFITMPHATMPDGSPLTWRVRAECAYGCKKADGSPETSFVQEVTGMFHRGGYGIDNPADPDDSAMVTKIVAEREEFIDGESVVTFQTQECK
jgi:hypothetical protein